MVRGFWLSISFKSPSFTLRSTTWYNGRERGWVRLSSDMAGCARPRSCTETLKLTFKVVGGPRACYLWGLQCPRHGANKEYMCWGHGSDIRYDLVAFLSLGTIVTDLNGFHLKAERKHISEGQGWRLLRQAGGSRGRKGERWSSPGPDPWVSLPEGQQLWVAASHWLCAENHTLSTMVLVLSEKWQMVFHLVFL